MTIRASRSEGLRLAPGLALVLALLSPVALSPASPPQLRPVEPIDWTGFEEERGSMSIGAMVLGGQRAALLGTEGRLVELGTLEFAVRVDRLLIHVRASPYRRFVQSARFDDRFAEPAVGVERADGTRVDAGTVLVSTTLPLGRSGARDTGRQQFVVRFGMRLPTTDDVIGIERDETDVFLSVGTRRVVDAWDLAAEVGVAIFGRATGEGQTDPILYGASIRRTGAAIRPYAEWIGHHDTRRGGAPRGNENLGEVRIGLRTGDRWWLDAHAIVGVAEFSPDVGGRVRLGVRF